MSTVSGNPFAALAQGDSDSESETEGITLQQQATAPSTPALHVPSSPPFRIWNLQGEERSKGVFAASNGPFSSKKKRGKVVHQPADHEGWVSIKKNQPHLIDDSANSSDTEQEIKKEALLEALGELTTLESASTPLESTGGGMRPLLSRGQNEMTALDWAERVRASLERAESQRRPASQTDTFVSSLGRVSFFRRAETTGATNNA